MQKPFRSNGGGRAGQKIGDPTPTFRAPETAPRARAGRGRGRGARRCGSGMRREIVARVGHRLQRGDDARRLAFQGPGASTAPAPAGGRRGMPLAMGGGRRRKAGSIRRARAPVQGLGSRAPFGRDASRGCPARTVFQGVGSLRWEGYGRPRCPIQGQARTVSAQEAGIAASDSEAFPPGGRSGLRQGRDGPHARGLRRLGLAAAWRLRAAWLSCAMRQTGVAWAAIPPAGPRSSPASTRRRPAPALA